MACFDDETVGVDGQSSDKSQSGTGVLGDDLIEDLDGFGERMHVVAKGYKICLYCRA